MCCVKNLSSRKKKNKTPNFFLFETEDIFELIFVLLQVGLFIWCQIGVVLSSKRLITDAYFSL